MSIACPTCNLVNNDDETNCRRCYSPLVVSIRGVGTTKTYSRRYIGTGIVTKNFSWIRLITTCTILIIAGFFLNRAALKLGKEPPRYVVAKPKVAQILQLSTRYENDQLFLTNNDGFNWPAVEIVINHDSNQKNGCCWKITIPGLNSHDTIDIQLNNFKNESGESFNITDTKIRTLQFNCSINGNKHSALASFE
jgi:hypothetical protein